MSRLSEPRRHKKGQFRARACTFACVLARLCVRVRARIGSAYRPRDTLRYVVCIMQSLCKPKMSPPPLPTVTVAYSVDGQWHVQRMNVMAIVVFFLPPTAQSAAPRKAKRAPPPRCPSPQFLAGVLEALCASGLDDTLQVEKNPHVRLSWIPLLSACRLRGDGPERERFGKLEHWSALIESTGAPSIVLYVCSERQFFVVCRKSTNTQPINTRSAICWLRTTAGLGFCFHDARGVSRIVVSRRADSDDDPWSECLARLMSAVPVVFPECSFDDEI